MNDILNKYIEHNKTIYENKKLKQFEYSKRVLFTTKNGREYSLFDANQYNLKTKASIYENEISSILRVLYNNVAIFRTSTTNSKYNIKSSDKSFIDINKVIKNQYERLKEFHSHRWQFKNNNIRLKARNLKIYELTELLNLHSNTVDVLSSTNDLLHYIKALVLARKKYDIGRVELLVNKYTLKKIKSLFIDNYVVVRINNKEKILYLKENGEEFVIRGIGDKIKGGNYIYFKVMDSKKNSKRAIIRYFYKNLLSERYENKPTKEHIIFSKLGIRIQQFSKDFFNRGVSKKILYKTNNKLFYMIKHKMVQLNPTKEDIEGFLFYTASLFRKQFFRREQNKEVDFIYLCKKDKWIDILNLKTYEKEGFLESFLNNVDIYRQKDYLSKFDKNIKQFFKELSIKKIQTRGSFIKCYKLKEFYLENYISKLWVQYLEYLYYVIRKIDLDTYMNEKILLTRIFSVKIQRFFKF